MSLISDALKKAQQERGQGGGVEELPPEPPRQRGVLTTKRMVIYGGLFVVIVVAVILATVVFKPAPSSNMRALNIRNTPSQPAANPSQAMKPSPSPDKAAQPREKSVPATVKTDPVPAPVKVQPTPPARQAPPKTRVVTPPKKTETQKPEPALPKKQPKTVVETTRAEVVESTRVKPSTAKELTVSDIIGEGDALMNQKQYAAAVEAYKKALSMERGIGVYLKLYSAFRAMKNRVLAKAYIDDGLKYYPDDFYLNKIAAVLHIRSRDYGRAMVHVNKAISKNDADYSLYTYRGLCFFHAGDYANGAANFQKSLELNSDAVENYYYMGLIYDNREQYKKALEYYNAFFKLNDQGKNFKHRDWVVRRMRLLRKYVAQQEQRK